MAARIIASPNPGRCGHPIYFIGDGFTGAAEVTLSVAEVGFSAEIVADADGAFTSGGAVGDHSEATLSSTGNCATGNTLTIAGRTYTMRDGTATLLPNEIRVGGNASASLDNIKAAINNDAGEGTTYGLGTLPHELVFASKKTATTILFYARTPGAANDALATTDTLANMAFGGGTFAGGAAAGAASMGWLPARAGTYHAAATDGTNSASVSVRVFT